MNNSFTKILIVASSVFAFIACKKETKTVSPSTPTVKTDTIVPPKIITGIELYNQALDTINGIGKKYYNVSTGTYSNSAKSNIDFAFAYYQPSNNSTKHILGCARSSRLKTLHGIPTTNNNTVDFYVINDGNNSTIYDTIKNSKSIASIFTNKATLSEFENDSYTIASDGFGWEAGDILGFKLSNGKRGLIKLTAKPTGSKDASNLTGVSSGKIVFDIKMEP
ncbi:MAG: hypothetical protein U0V72_03850 [Cytophagales bacterium]